MDEQPLVIRDSLDPDTVLAGRYKIERMIGSGGMASVYLASDLHLENKKIALKVLHSQFAEDKSYVKRFLREVQLMNKVSHKNVVKTFDIGTDKGSIFFTMEYVPADSLEKLIDTCAFTERQIAQLTIEICKGLRAIHEIGIIHRDLKPANILVLKDGSIKITDFGVARERYSRLTSKTQKVGSVCYMAPEIWLGKKLTAAIDFYSLGVVLYELTTGDVPFEHEWPGELMRMHLEEAVVPPIEVNKNVPSWLNELILRLLSKTPKGRPKSAEEISVYVKLYGPLGTDGKGDRPLLDDRKPFGDVQLSEEEGFNIPKAKQIDAPRGKTYVLELTATRLIDEAGLAMKEQSKKRKATVVIRLPRRAAVVVEIEAPSRDFIFLGVFLASLQVFDGMLTSMGLTRFGTHAEGNPMMRFLIEHIGAHQALVTVKVMAVVLVAFLTVLAKRAKWIKDLIGVLSCIYLFAAVLPWIYLLFVKYDYFIH
jgi:tRNA A-37 threonylcarbamoyl transferase component Bud32